MSETQVTTSPRFRFDGTVHLGHLLIIIGFMVSGFLAYSSIRETLSNHDWRLEAVEKNIEVQSRVNAELRDSLNSIARDIAVIRTKVDTVEGKVTNTK